MAERGRDVDALMAVLPQADDGDVHTALDGGDVGEALAADGSRAAELACAGHRGHVLGGAQGLARIRLDAHDELALEGFDDGMHVLPFRVYLATDRLQEGPLSSFGEGARPDLQGREQVLGRADEGRVALELADQDRRLEKGFEGLAGIALRNARLPGLAAPIRTLVRRAPSPALVRGPVQTYRDASRCSAAPMRGASPSSSPIRIGVSRRGSRAWLA